MQFHPKILNFRDKGNAYTSQNECFYTSKTILLYNTSNAFSICSQSILLTNYVVLEIQKDNFSLQITKILL